MSGPLTFSPPTLRGFSRQLAIPWQLLQIDLQQRLYERGDGRGRIRWPFSRPLSVPALVVFADLERAIRTESSIAVTCWWGVSVATVLNWRRALGVGQYNVGTVKLRRAGYDDPDRSCKMRVARLGKPRPPEVIEKMKATRKRRYGK